MHGCHRNGINIEPPVQLYLKSAKMIWEESSSLAPSGGILFSAKTLALIMLHLICGTISLLTLLILVFQMRVPHRIIDATEAGVPLVIHGAVLQRAPRAEILQARRAEETPNLLQMPVYHGMDTHKRRPVVVRGVEMRQMPPVRIRPPSAHEDRLHLWVLVKVQGESVAEGDDGSHQGEIVALLLRGGVQFRGRMGQRWVRVRSLFFVRAWVGKYMCQVEVVQLGRVLDEAGDGGEWIGGFGVDGRNRLREGLGVCRCL